MKAILWDLDSCLCNTMHRQHMVPLIRASKNQGPTWVDYSMACIADTPVEGAVALARLIGASYYTDADGNRCRYRQLGVSGRNESARFRTEEWLRRHAVPLDDVILRADDDFSANGAFKVEVIRKLREQRVNVVLFMEDWKETARDIREGTGVPVCVLKGEYLEETPVSGV